VGDAKNAKDEDEEDSEDEGGLSAEIIAHGYLLCGLFAGVHGGDRRLHYFNS
jgi:hypothetical protein